MFIFRLNDENGRMSRLGMFEGDSENVRIRCENHLANVIIDRFGNDIPIINVDKEHFETTVKVSVSRMFLGWIMSLPGVQIVSPKSTVDMMKKEIATKACKK